MKFFALFILCIPLKLWSQDTIPPVISNFWSDGDSIGVFTDYKSQVPEYSVIDDTDGDITAQAQIIGSVDTSQLGSYQLSIIATDKASNTTKITVNLQVVDTTAPVLILNGDNPVCVSLGHEYIDAGTTASDNYAPTVDVAITVGGSLVNTYTSGWYCVNYQAVDPSGNQSNVIHRTVYIDLIDSGKPCDFISGKVCGKDPLSIVAYKTPEMEVYPNPSQGAIQISADYSLNHVEVYTLTGQKVIDQYPKESSLTLDFPAKGLFYLIVHSSQGMVKKLLVVE